MSSSAYNRHHGAHEAFTWVKRIAAITPRDVELLTMLSHGYSVKELAHACNTSQPMIKNRMASLRLFLHARTTVQAIAEALRKGIIK